MLIAPFYQLLLRQPPQIQMLKQLLLKLVMKKLGIITSQAKIVDLFQGQLKSEVTCNTCNEVCFYFYLKIFSCEGFINYILIYFSGFCHIRPIPRFGSPSTSIRLAKKYRNSSSYRSPRFVCFTTDVER